MTLKKQFAGDPRGGHVRLYWEVVDSNAWRCLGASDRCVYVALVRYLRSTNNGDLSLPLSVAKQHGIKSQTTLARSLRALVAVGLLAVTRKGGADRGGQRECTLYRLTDLAVYANPAKFIEASKATNEWKAVTTLGRGREAIRQAEAAAKAAWAAKQETKRAVQILTPTPLAIDVVQPETSTRTGPRMDRSPQKMNMVETPHPAAKPMPAQVST